MVAGSLAHWESVERIGAGFAALCPLRALPTGLIVRGAAALVVPPAAQEVGRSDFPLRRGGVRGVGGHLACLLALPERVRLIGVGSAPLVAAHRKSTDPTSHSGCRAVGWSGV
ncbi:hypothetical protein [Kitasatospora sp. NPDC093806]|uniref:hypothetical protein n=1 Tax=Kitasatospora sp. NPDC093806 TaxID=3155075 RepID=UPI00343B6F50